MIQLPERSDTEIENNNVEVDAVELKTIEIQINSIKDATQRSRFIFLVMTIVAATILAGLWNSMVSWDKDMAFTERSQNVLVRENQQIVTNEWLKNNFVSIGLLGIRVSALDLAVLGSISMVVVMIWYFFSQRRENRAIISLLRYCSDGIDAKSLPPQICRMVYEGVVQSIVFIDMKGGDEPVEGLSETTEDSKTRSVTRLILNFLIFLPPITIFAVILSDVISLHIHSYLRDTPEALWHALSDKSKVKVVVFDCIAMIMGIYTWILCNRSRQFSIATANTIVKFKELIPASRK